MACKYKNRVWDNGWCNVACRYCTMTQEETCKHNHQTNADRIRAMNNYELAVFLAKVKALVYRADLPVIAYSTGDMAENLEWLERPWEE